MTYPNARGFRESHPDDLWLGCAEQYDRVSAFLREKGFGVRRDVRFKYSLGIRLDVREDTPRQSTHITTSQPLTASSNQRFKPIAPSQNPSSPSTISGKGQKSEAGNFTDDLAGLVDFGRPGRSAAPVFAASPSFFFQ
jgi:hypothetical protein